MRAKKYETKIRKAILKYSIVTILLMLGIMVIILGLYNRAIRDYRLQNTVDDYHAVMNETIVSYDSGFYDENNNLLTRYLTDEVSDNQVYRAFYTFNAQQHIKGDLVILNRDLEQLLTTNPMFEEDAAFQHFLNIIIQNHETNRFELLTRVFRGLDHEMYFLMLKPIMNKTLPIGYTVSVINGKEFQHQSDVNTAHFAIVDQHNNVLSASTRMIMDHRDKLDASKFENNQRLNNEYQYKRQPVGENLSIISFVHAENQSYIFSLAVIFIVLLTIFVLIQSNYFSKRMSQRIGQSLYDLQHEMNKISAGDNDFISIKSQDEFEDLATEINSMLVDLRASHANILALNKQYVETEKKKLEAQFNPHFLANTLETIRAAMYFDKKISDQMIQDLNHILRYSIDESIVNTTLEEDMKYLIHYLSIHKNRHEEFTYSIHYDSSLGNIKLPKLFILPLIENSIKYGFKYRRDLKINLSVIKRGDEVIFRVIDNGHALKEELALELNKKLNDSNRIENQHGLRNTKQRITMLYPETTFIIFNKLSCTVVEIRCKGAKYV